MNCKDTIRSNTAHAVPISRGLMDVKSNRPSGKRVTHDVYLRQLDNANSFKARAEAARKTRSVTYLPQVGTTMSPTMTCKNGVQ
jgi:hypothetical protein